MLSFRRRREAPTLNFGGEMAALVRLKDWSATPLGPRETWPYSLHGAVNLVLASPQAMIVLWGPELVQIYNDAYASIAAEKHPDALGQPSRACWPEVWHFNAPIYEGVFRGESRCFQAQRLSIWRHGVLEDAWFDLTYSPLFHDGAVQGVLVTVIEVTAKVQTEALLRLNEKRLRALVTAASYVIYRMSPDWMEMRQLDGQGFLADTGSPSANWLTEYIYPDDQPHVWDVIQAAIRTKSMFELEHRVRRADGSLGWTHSRAIPLLDADGQIEEWFGAASDVTARKHVEEALITSKARLAEAARMEALGRLAGGMAHDFNNTLQAVQSRLHLADNRLESAPTEARVHLTRAIEATMRAVAVTGRLLAFARHSELHGEPIAPGQLLGSLAEILSPTLGAEVTLRIEADGELPALHADRAQLESVLINLAHNARDAMPRGGMLVLRATALSSAAEVAPPELTPGAFLRLSVIDQGEGMPPEMIARVTEPFFTTKPKGKGTGLGLAMARGFAEQSGGMLTIESTLGSGTTVSLWLPQTQNTDSAPSSTGIPVTAVAAPASGTAFTVLLAEDQPEVREVLALHLEEHGFTIIEAEHAAAAISLFDRGLRPDAVVTDFSMPGELDGIGLIQEARERWPCLPAVLVTGDTGVTIPEQLEALEREGAFLLLRKPVPAKVLVDCLARVLEDIPDRQRSSVN